MQQCNDRARICSADGCDRPYLAKSLCKLHYERARWRARAVGVTTQPCYRDGCTNLVTRDGPGLRVCDECRMSQRDSHLKWRYDGMTQQQYDELLLMQQHRCAICKTDRPGGRGAWHVDHCHDTGDVRGLLCSRCNRAIGLFGDDPKQLIAAAAYLERHRQLKLVV